MNYWKDDKKKMIFSLMIEISVFNHLLHSVWSPNLQEIISLNILKHLKIKLCGLEEKNKISTSLKELRNLKKKKI